MFKKGQYVRIKSDIPGVPKGEVGVVMKPKVFAAKHCALVLYPFHINPKPLKNVSPNAYVIPHDNLECVNSGMLQMIATQQNDQEDALLYEVFKELRKDGQALMHVTAYAHKCCQCDQTTISLIARMATVKLVEYAQRFTQEQSEAGESCDA